MGPTSWIARVVRLAQSLRADYWGEPRRPDRWALRPDLRPDPLAVRRLEPRRVLTASIQAISVPADIVEGDTVEVSAEATGAGGMAFDWTITRDSTVIAVGSAPDFSFVAPDDGDYRVTLSITDAQGQGVAAEADFSVANAPPRFTGISADAISENGLTTLRGVVEDPGANDQLTLEINWGDPLSPGNTQTIDLSDPPEGVTYDAATGRFTATHRYLDDNPSGTPFDSYTVALRVLDGDGGQASASTSVSVFNVPPTLSGVLLTAADENGVTQLTGRVSDPGGLDTLTLTIHWGEPPSPGNPSPANEQTIDLSNPGPGVSYNPATGRFTITHQYLDDNPSGTPSDQYVVSVAVADDDGGQTSLETSVTVNNVAPRLVDVAAQPVDANGVTTLSGAIVDPGTRDTHTLRVDWGDGTHDVYAYAAGVTTFSETHAYADLPIGEPVTISITLEDDDAGTDSAAIEVQVANVAPTITGLAATSVSENQKTLLTGVVTDPNGPDNLRLVIDWGDLSSPGNLQVIELSSPPDGATYDPETGAFSVEHLYPDDNPSGTAFDDLQISVRAEDGDGGEFTALAGVRVSNVAPLLTAVAATEINEAGATTLSGTIVDPGPLDSFSLTVAWGDGTQDTYAYPAGTTTFSVTHAYPDDNPTGSPADDYRVELTLSDDDGGQATAIVLARVNNLPPTLSQLAATTISEGGSTVLSGVLTDPSALDTHTLEITWGDPLSPGNEQTIDLSSPPDGVTYDAETGAFTVTHQYLDDNPTGTPVDKYKVSVRVIDDDGGVGEGSTTVTVNNAAPALQGVSATSILENGVTTLSGTLTDAGVLDTHTLEINWGDPLSAGNVQTIDLSSPPDGVTYNAETGAFTVTHQYLDDNPTGTPVDSYTISVRAVDDDGGEGSASTSVQVGNAAPSLSGTSATSVLENGVTTLSGTIADVGALDTHTLEINWGDPLSPGNVQTIDLSAPPDGVTYNAETGAFTVTHQYLDDNPTGTPVDSYTVAVRVLDDDGGQASTTTTLSVFNVPPTLSGVQLTPVDENGVALITGHVNDPGSLDTHTLTINWGDPLSPGDTQVIDLANPGPGVTYNPETGAFTIEHQYLDDNPSGTPSDQYVVGVSIADDDGGQTSLETSVTVSNVAPRLVDIQTVPVDENGLTTLSGRIVDPGTLDTHTLTINWGDPLSPGNEQTVDLSSPPDGVTYNAQTGAFTVTHQYLDDNPSGTTADQYLVSLTVTDDDGGLGSAEAAITVGNVAPQLAGVEAQDVNENGVTTLSGRIVDPGALDTFTLTVNWDDGVVEEYTTLPGGAGISLLDPPEGVTYDPVTREFTIQHQYLDDNPTGTPSDPYTIRVTLVDDDADMAVDAATITVSNVAPVITQPANVQLLEGQTLYIGADAALDGVALPGIVFTDPGTQDSHEATIDWGDGTATESLVVVQNGAAQVRTALLVGGHTFADNGVYTAVVTVTDDDGGQDQITFTVTVTNVDPELTGTDGLEVFEGQGVTLAGLGVGVTDPGFDNPLNTSDPSNGGEVAETFVGLSINWGDGSAATTVAVVDRVNGSPGLPTTAGFSHDAHYYADDGQYTVTVTLSDDDGPAVARTFEVLVKNVDPTLVLTDEVFVINEGEVLFLPGLGAFTDPGAANPLNPNGASDETFTYSIDWGDGTVDELQLPVSVVDGGAGVGKSGAIANEHFYADNDIDNRYTITVTLTDDDGGVDQQSFEITVYNVSPSLQPLNPDELLDDPWTPGILVDANDLESDGLTTLVIRFADPGADTFQLWIDWGDKLGLPEGDQRYVAETPINTVVAEDGVTLLFAHAYTAPPDPLNPAADIAIRALVADDDYMTATGGQLVFGAETSFVIEPGRSDAGLTIITNAGIDNVNVAIDTTADVQPLEFPALEEYVAPAGVQSGAVSSQQTQESDSSGGDQTAASERVYELRVMRPDGTLSAPYRLSPDVLDHLPELFARLPDGRYLIYVVRTDNDTRRLVMDLVIRNGRPIDVSDDSDGARDRPPLLEDEQPAAAIEELPLLPEAVVPDAPADQGAGAAAGPQAAAPWQLPHEPTAEPRPEGATTAALAASGGLAVGVARTRAAAPRAAGQWRQRVEHALEHADERDWILLNALRRRPR